MTKRILSAVLLLTFALLLCACGETAQAPSSPEDVYLQQAEAFLAQGDRETAIAALQEGISVTGSERLKARLAELTGASTETGTDSSAPSATDSSAASSTDSAEVSTDLSASDSASDAVTDLPATGTDSATPSTDSSVQPSTSVTSTDAGSADRPADTPDYSSYCGFYKSVYYDDVEISDLGNGVLRIVKTGERGAVSGTLNVEDIVKNKGIVTLSDEVGTSFDSIFEFTDGSVLMDREELISFDLSDATLDVEGFFGGTNVTLESGDWYLTYHRYTCYPVLELQYGQAGSVVCKILAPIDQNGYKTIPVAEDPYSVTFQLEDKYGAGGFLSSTFGEGTGGNVRFTFLPAVNASGKGKGVRVNLESNVEGIPSARINFSVG